MSVKLSSVVFLAVSVFSLVSCGGGGGTSSPATGATTAPASSSGTVQGFGSVVVNGCRWATLGAEVHDDFGNPLGVSNLAMGMQVQIDGSVGTNGANCLAEDIEVAREFAGEISAVGTNQFTVLGQTVVVNSNTFYKGFAAATFDQIAVGTFVEVYGLKASDGSVLATLVERKQSSADLTNGYEARGVVSNLNTSLRTFNLGSLLIDYSNLTTEPAGLANDVVVKVKGITLMGGTLQVDAVNVRNLRQIYANSELEVKGFVEDDGGDQDVNTFTVAGFAVNVRDAKYDGLSGLTVGNFVELEGTFVNQVLQVREVETEESRDAARGGRYEFYGVATNGTFSNNVLAFDIHGQSVSFTQDVCGVSTGTPYVEVTGNLVDGVVQATKVECGRDDDDDGFENNSFELSGFVSEFDSSTTQFVLEGVKVRAASAKFVNGTVADLRNGREVELVGSMDANQEFLIASEVDFED